MSFVQTEVLSEQSWHEANQRYLMTALAVVREALQRHVDDAGVSEGGSVGAASDVSSESAREELRQIAAAMPAPPTLGLLCTTFQLSPFERDVILLCAGLELDSSFASLCAAAQGDPQRAYPTFSLALAALLNPHWSALTPAAPLRHWRLLEIGTGSALVAAPLRVDERILHYLTGVQHLDEHLIGFVQPLRVEEQLAPSQRVVAERIAAVWTQASGQRILPVVQLCGQDMAGKQDIAAAACRTLGLNVYRLLAHVIPTTPHELDTLTRLWEREAALSASALLLDCEFADGSDMARESVVTQFVENVGGALIITGRERQIVRHRPLITFDVQKPTSDEQRALWHGFLEASTPTLNGQVNQLVDQFDLSAAAIRSASTEALGALSSAQETSTSLGTLLWNSCRDQARPQIEDLARRIEPAATWDELVLPQPQLQTLREVAVHVRQRTRVYEEWGFASRWARGLGISALFAGPSGTGKTMAAEVLANELRLDLYHIDLSQVVSKYIGETEKNLRRVFDAAEEGGAILLFDEADALFGKRSEVKDSHDRYANIEVSYLLQRMEAYRGLAILTSNMKNALDGAFLRRIRFIVQFPFPDRAQRVEIWRRIFPAETPTRELDVEKLAHLNVAGGNIRNIALNAAFLAADAGEPVRMVHILHAAQSEYAKLEKPLTEAEIRGWV